MTVTQAPVPAPPVPGETARHRRTTPAGPRLVSAGRLAAVLWVVGLAVATWPLLAPPDAPPPLAALAHASGMLAGVGVLVLLLLVARTPALEHGVGADVLARWHVRGAPAVLTLVVVHAVAATAAWAGAGGTSLLGGAWEILGEPWLQAAVVGTLLMLLAAGVSVRAARRRLSHERWHGVHLLMYVAVALGFGHQLVGPDLAGHRWLQVGWALAYAWTFAAVLHHRVITPARQATRHRLHVTAVHAEGPGVTTIVVGGQHLDELAAQPGQFFRWRFLTPDHWANAHPFSLSAAPTNSRLRLTVKDLGDGSRDLQHLPVGTWVLAEGPYGVVTPQRRSGRGVLLVAGGVGITPMRALFQAVPLAPGEDLLLLYRARSPDDVLFRAELDEIAARRGARVLYGYSGGPDLLGAEALLDVAPDLASRDVYVCGPARLMDAVRASTREAGLPPERLHEERFAL